MDKKMNELPEKTKQLLIAVNQRWHEICHDNEYTEQDYFDDALEGLSGVNKDKWEIEELNAWLTKFLAEKCTDEQP